MTRASRWVLSLAPLFCFLPTVGFTGLNNWTVQGPPGGYFRQVAVSPTDSKIMYAAYSRSVHKSTDGGDTWQTIREFKNQINSLVVAPDDGNVYLGVLSDGVFRSDDQGSTYTQIAPGNFGGPWGVGVSGSTLYYGNGGAFYRSTDRGVSWTARTNPPQTLTTILVDPSNPDSIFGFAGPYLVRSVDGGSTWTQTSVTTSSSITDVVMFSATSLVACASDGFYVSRNGGSSWTRNTTGNGCVGIATDKSSPGTMLAGLGSSQTGFVYRSLDYGDTWNFVGTTPNGPANGILFGPGSPASYVVVNGQGAMRSTNSGINWSEVTQGPIASTAQFATTSGTNSKIYAYALGLTNGTAALYANSGVNNAWQRLNLNAAQSIKGQPFGQGTLAVKPGDPETIYLGAFSIGLFRSSNGGAAWQSIGAGLSGYGIDAIAFDPNDAATMYAKVSFGGNTPTTGLYRSVDGGLTWSPRSGASLRQDAFGLAMIVDRANPSHLLLAAYQGFGPTGTGGLYQSNDAGVNWTQMFVGEDVRSIAQDPAIPSIFYVAAYSGLQVSLDGGVTFNPNNQFSIITAQPAGSIVIDPIVPTTIYAASLDPNNSSTTPQKFSYVLRSIDRGATWETLRKESDAGFWAISQLVLDPTTPSILYANAELHGAATFEVAPDLALTLSGHSGTKPLGAQSSFDVRVDNRGPYAATSVRITTLLPASLTSVSATVDRGSCTVISNNVECIVSVLQNGDNVNAHVSYTAPTAVQIAISPSVTAHERDSVTANNSAQGSVIVGEVADLGVALSPSINVATSGAGVTYTLTITNNGPSIATDASATVTPGANVTLGTPPSGCSSSGATIVCGTGSLSVGGARVFAIPATVNTSGQAVVNASVSPIASAGDPVSSNNTVQATVSVNAPPTSSGGGSSGGGSFGLEWVALLSIVKLGRMRTRLRYRVGTHSGHPSISRRSHGLHCGWPSVS